MSRFVVYRMYDPDEALLYVGHSSRGIDRIEEHRFKDWWRDVDIVTVEHFTSRHESLAAERKAIVDEAPKHNKLGVPAKLVELPRPPVGVASPSESIVQILPEALRSWREQRGMTEDDLAARADMTSLDIQLIESRGGMPLYGDALRIAEALGIPLAAIAYEVAAS